MWEKWPTKSWDCIINDRSGFLFYATCLLGRWWMKNACMIMIMVSTKSKGGDFYTRTPGRRHFLADLSFCSLRDVHLYIVHCRLYIVQAVFSLILKLWLRFPDLKGNSVAAVCGDSTARICFAPWMSECQRRWALFVCLHSCRQVLFVCLFIYLFVYPPIKLHHLSLHAEYLD